MSGKFNRGPGTYLKEIDLTEVSSPVGSSVAAVVVKANQGIVNSKVLIGRDQEYIQTFGEPNPNLGYGGYAALELLKATNQLYASRVTSGTEGYAHSGVTTSASGAWKQILATGSTSLLNITGYEDGNTPSNIYDANNYSFSGELFHVMSIGPGSYGNNLAFQIVTSASPVSAGFDWQYNYDVNPLTDLNPIWPKVFKINVFQKSVNALGFNSVSGSPVESFYVSRQQLVDDNGNNLYLETVINGISKYIYVKDNALVSDSSYPSLSSGLIPLLSGTDNTTVSQGNIQSVWSSLYSDPNKVDVNILLCTECGDKNSSNYATQQIVGNIAAARQDCIAVVQVDGTSATVSNATTMANNAGYDYNNPSYVAPYVGWDLIYDKFNDRNIYIPKAIYGASIMARVPNPWDAIAGVDNGRISSLGQSVIFSDSQISTLDDAHLNTSKFIRGTGNVMWLQSTALRKNSALASINVRRLLLYVEKTVINSLLPFMFKPNNAKTRQRIKTILDNFLGQVASGGGFNTDEDAGFLVQCDSTNNTAQTIANEELVVNIFVKPIRVIKYVSLNMIITNSGISFSELV